MCACMRACVRVCVWCAGSERSAKRRALAATDAPPFSLESVIASDATYAPPHGLSILCAPLTRTWEHQAGSSLASSATPRLVGSPTGTNSLGDVGAAPRLLAHLRCGPHWLCIHVTVSQSRPIQTCHDVFDMSRYLGEGCTQRLKTRTISRRGKKKYVLPRHTSDVTTCLMGPGNQRGTSFMELEDHAPH